MGCTSGIMKCILNTLNVILGIGGILLIVVATLSLNTAPQVFLYYLYIVGVVTLLVSLLGCCGVCQEDVCMTSTYAIVILALLITQLVGKFYVMDSEAIRKFAVDDVAKTWNEELIHPGAMNKTQQTYECCGKTQPNDYLEIGRVGYPLSCYPNSRYNVTALYSTGCTQAAEKWFLDIFNYSSSGEWANLVCTAVVFIFAVFLVIRFRNKQRRYNY